MSLYEIPNNPKYGTFTATLGTDGDFEGGMIRIEPPINPGKRIVKWAKDDGIILEHLVSTDESTLFDYGIKSDLQGTREENITRVSNLLACVLECLGQSEDIKLFVQEWEKYSN